MGARIAGDSKGAGVSVAGIGRDQRNLYRTGTRCDPYSLGPSGIKVGLAAESDVPAVKSIRQGLVNSSKSQA